MKLPEGYVNGVPPRKATAMGGFGQNMLERMGWQNGQGLGKNRQGRNAPIAVVKKDDNVGLGGKRGWDWQADYAAQAYEQAIAKVQGHENSDSSSSDSSDDEHTDFCPAGTISGASHHELKLARALAKGNNLGRFGARAGKMRRIQEQEAVLAGQMDLVASSKTERTCTVRAPDCTHPEPQAKGQIFVVGVPEVDSATLLPPDAQPSSWWGHKRFLSGGWLGGLQEDQKKRVEARSFTAATQEAIYKSAMSQKVQVCEALITVALCMI
jgi:hypothetical protein